MRSDVALFSLIRGLKPRIYFCSQICINISEILTICSVPHWGIRNLNTSKTQLQTQLHTIANKTTQGNAFINFDWGLKFVGGSNHLTLQGAAVLVCEL